MTDQELAERLLEEVLGCEHPVSKIAAEPGDARSRYGTPRIDAVIANTGLLAYFLEAVQLVVDTDEGKVDKYGFRWMELKIIYTHVGGGSNSTDAVFYYRPKEDRFYTAADQRAWMDELWRTRPEAIRAAQAQQEEAPAPRVKLTLPEEPEVEIPRVRLALTE
jgi:hypothetical protein